jgi:alkaline phosphatase
VTNRLTAILLLVCALGATAADKHAKNVILFLGDAGGIPTLNAASIQGFGEPQKLYLQSMPHIALSDTSSASAWVTDSAAGMTAIVTGRKTHNNVLSQNDKAIEGKQDGDALKTILEYAEEKGLSTGVLTNKAVFDATPAACYAHANSRKLTAEILTQFLNPRFGDGVDVLIGSGRATGLKATAAAGSDWVAEAQRKGYQVVETVEAMDAKSKRAVVWQNDENIDLPSALQKTIAILSRNPKGYFLMVEWDMHTDKVAQGLTHVLEMDRAIAQSAKEFAGKNTLILFTADHSFDLRVRGGKKGEALISAQPVATAPAAAPRPSIRMDNGHTGEEVLVAAQGPGAERVHGFLPNTRLFQIMMDAYGWSAK